MSEDIKLEDLAPHQIQLHHKLADKCPLLARIYRGALFALASDLNPDYLALAAHDLRELMEKFPRYVNIQIRPDIPMSNKINQLEQDWEKAQKSTCKQEGAWAGNIDEDLEIFLKSVDEFFEWKKSDVSSRTEKVIRTLRELDAAKKKVPVAIERIMAQIWKEMNSYFQGVAHHGKETSEEEFRGYLISLEDFLIERINPRTFNILDSIDRIIDPKEVDAN